MIIGFIINLVVLLFTFLFTFLPKVTALPFNLDTTLTTVYGYFHAATSIFPFLTTAINFFLLGVSIELGYKTYQVVRRFINWIRGSG